MDGLLRSSDRQKAFYITIVTEPYVQNFRRAMETEHARDIETLSDERDRNR